MLASQGVPQAERHRHGRNERKAIPVLDRIPQPGDPCSVRKEVRDDLPSQRPGQHRSKQQCEPARDHAELTGYRGAHEQPEDEEGEIDDAAVEVLPGEVRCNRPPDRRAAPHHERSEQRDEHEAGTVKPGPGNTSEAAECEQRAGDGDRERPQPDERPVGRAAAEEEGESDEHAGSA
jgi:hypothetical protein